jgi:hypothetical protein
MSTRDIFESSVRSSGDVGAFFEYDGETGYFYLHDQPHGPDHKVINALRILNTRADFQQEDVRVDWDPIERYVGLFIRGQLWAAFDTSTGAKYGGDYCSKAISCVPSEIAHAFAQT